MLTYLKAFLKALLVPILYLLGIATMIVSMFKDAKWGLFLLILTIPQPNVWYKFHEYPFGKDFMDLLFFAIICGIFIQRLGWARTQNSMAIMLYILISYAATVNASFNFSLPFPVSGANPILLGWKNYAQMIFLYFIALNVLKDEERQKQVVMAMTAVICLIAVRSFRNFSGGESFDYDKRVGGPFEAVGLGANHLGAFISDYTALVFAFVLMEKDRLKRYFSVATCAFSLHPLFFSYSRGAYLATAAAFTFFGLVKKRMLLAVMVGLVVAWQVVLPASVVDRIQMTESAEGELESSAAHRLDLWEHAVDVFKSNPVFGVGFNAFGFTVAEGELTDTHNFYLKTLAEQGIIGFALLMMILCKSFLSGLRLYRNGTTDFQRTLGLGFMGTVIAMSITNLFGDRWSYFVLGSYFWVLWGMVDRSILNAADEKASTAQKAAA